MTAKMKTENTTPTAAQMVVREHAFDEAIASAQLVADIKAAGKADKRTKREFVIGRAMRLMLKAARLADYLAAGDNARQAIRAELATQVEAIAGRKGWLDPAKANADAAKILRKEMRDGTRRNKSDHAMIRAAERAWSRFCNEHGLTQKSNSAGNVNAKRKPQGSQSQDAPASLNAETKRAQKPGIDAVRAGVVPAAETVPGMAKGADVTAWLQREAAEMMTCLNKNAKHVSHVQREIMRDFISAVKALTEES